jgi:hypothetical protein
VKGEEEGVGAGVGGVNTGSHVLTHTGAAVM